MGDFEQLEARPFYALAGFVDLYRLATTEGRTQIQILNYSDPCCFAARGREAEVAEYEAEVLEAARAYGGHFEVYAVRDHRGHEVSADARERMVRALAEAL
jgi:hypothetical protein